MNDYNYLVSVIVPNYCHSRFLDQRIDSILNQTYQNFELILLDDYSPDDGASKSIIEKYRDNPHVSHIVYNDVNSGSTFKQWDKGINLAKGELIWIAESDDYCDPLFLETLVMEFERDQELSLAYTLVKRVDINGRLIRIIQFTPFWITRLDGLKYIKRYLSLDNHCVNASACLFKKSAYFAIDKHYVEYKACGDWLFWINIANQGNVAIINKRLAYFRRWGSGVTFSSSKKDVEIKEKIMISRHLLKNYKLSRCKQLLIKQNIKYLYEKKKDSIENKDLKDVVNTFLGDSFRWSKTTSIKMKVLNIIRPKMNLYF